MSVFNLDRFRFDKKSPTPKHDKHNGSISPESEKENKPVAGRASKSLSMKCQGRGVVFDDSNSDSEDDSSSNKLIRKAKEPVKRGGKREVKEEGVDKEEVEERLTKLLDVFPQRSRQELLEVVESTSTVEGAVAACLLRYGDKEDPDTRKRKHDGSSSSQDSDVVQPSKKRRPSEAEDSDQEGEEPSWEKQEAMVRRLQRKFPDQDKEELRAVLQEHG